MNECMTHHNADSKDHDSWQAVNAREALAKIRGEPGWKHKAFHPDGIDVKKRGEP